MRAFIDTNVIVDVVAKREPFFADSQAILALCAMGEINVRHFKTSPIRVCTPSELLAEDSE